MTTAVKKNLLFIQLNEINFDLVRLYLKANPKDFPNLNKLLMLRQVETSSEAEYSKLEPWIQWVSVHTGLDYHQHKVFRLGDIENSDVNQLFEILESNDVKVGAICPMNAKNRLKSPAFFLPDPWTKTKTDGSFWSRILTSSISQAVNDNTNEKLSLKSLAGLLIGLIRFARVKNYFLYLKLALTSRKAPWRKALFLDLFLHDLYCSRVDSTSPGFSSLFLNAGAHIQHHYIFSASPIKVNSKNRNPSWYIKDYLDPIEEMIKIYDHMIGQWFQMKGNEVIISTGLSQKPYDRLKYYYRLKDHTKFLSYLKINYKSISPRMTRDFLIEFENKNDLEHAKSQLESLIVLKDNVRLFNEIEERPKSLFVTLTYPNEIVQGTFVSSTLFNLDIFNFVNFVAIKNGMHDEKGYAFFSPGIQAAIPLKKAHVKELFNTILAFFDVKYKLSQN
jgi:hypothetical protein